MEDMLSTLSGGALIAGRILLFVGTSILCIATSVSAALLLLKLLRFKIKDEVGEKIELAIIGIINVLFDFAFVFSFADGADNRDRTKSYFSWYTRHGFRQCYGRVIVAMILVGGTVIAVDWVIEVLDKRYNWGYMDLKTDKEEEWSDTDHESVGEV